MRDSSTSLGITKLERLRDYAAETAIILGSGLNSLVADATDDELIAYSEFGEIPQPTVPGHAGCFVLGKIDIGGGGSRATKTGEPERVGEPGGESINVRVIFAQGRVHLYEGYSAREVTSIVRVL